MLAMGMMLDSRSPSFKERFTKIHEVIRLWFRERREPLNIGEVLWGNNTGGEEGRNVASIEGKHNAHLCHTISCGKRGKKTYQRLA
jgi:hypothetical protein